MDHPIEAGILSERRHAVHQRPERRVLTFIDRHPLSSVPSEVRSQMHLEAVHGIVDQSGTLPIGHWIEDGYIYCLVRAPSARAVCEHHAQRGLGCDEVHPIDGLRGSRPLTGDEEQIVRASIAELWHSERALR